MAGGSHNREATIGEAATWAAAAMVAAHTHKIPVASILQSRARGPGRPSGSLTLARALREAIYLASVGGNLSRRALERVTGLDRTSILKHLRSVEDDRELGRTYDELLESLTVQLQASLRFEPRRVAA